MTEIRPRRSVLCLPGTNPFLPHGADAAASDAILLDLEDAVAPAAKAEARAAVAAAVAGRHHGRREVVVRINALDGPHGEADLAAMAAAGPDAILVPKVTGPDTLVAVGSRLRRLGAPQALRVWATIESPLAVLHAGDIASAARDVDTRLSCLVVDGETLAASARIRADAPGRPALMPWLMSVVAAARAYEIDAIDGAFAAIADAAGFLAEAKQARACGFDGKVVIDRSQVGAANDAFAPSPTEVERARAILADPARDGGGAEDRAIDEARRTVALAAAIRALRT